MSCALAFPLFALAPMLGAEEITVTVPPDDPPAQATPAQQGFDPTAHPTDDAPLPSASPGVSAQADPEPAPAEQPEETPPPAAAEAPAAEPAAPEAAAPDTGHTAAEATPAPAPVVKKAHKKTKKAAALKPAGESTAEASDAAAPAKAAKKKTKSVKKASCLNLTVDQCGTNTACVWVAAGTNDAGKAVKARCRSLAILKRETDKVHKAAAKSSTKAAGKESGPEVLPWATGGATASTATTATAESKPAKKKPVAHKRKPKPAEAPPVVPSSSDASGAD